MAQLAKTSIDPEYSELTADVFIIHFMNLTIAGSTLTYEASRAARVGVDDFFLSNSNASACKIRAHLALPVWCMLAP